MIYRRPRLAVDARPTLSRYDVLDMAGPVAQRLEQRTHNPLVLGSNPSGPTNTLSSHDFSISLLAFFSRRRPTWNIREQTSRDPLHSAFLRVGEQMSEGGAKVVRIMAKEL